MFHTRTLTGLMAGLLALLCTLTGPGPARGQMIIQIPGGSLGNPGPWNVGPLGGPTSRPATTHPAIKLDIKPEDPVKKQAEALAKVIDVSYRRDFPIEVLQDLARRTGLRYALPGPLDKAYLFTYEAKGVTVKEVLQKLAEAGRDKAENAALAPPAALPAPDAPNAAQLDLRPDLAVLTRKASEETLADLQKKLADPDRWERIHAIWGLANLSDPRVYPPLVKMLADKDPGVVEWTLKGLEKHILMVGLWPEADRNTLAEVLLKWFEKADFSPGQNRGMAWGAFSIGGVAPADPTLQRMRLLAATRRPQAIAALVQYLTKGEQIQGRCDAATVLGEFGQAQAELLAVMKQSGTKWETYSKQQAEKQAKWWADHAEDQKQGKPITLPQDLYSWDPKMFEQQRLYYATRRALLVMKDPGVVTKALTDYLYPSGNFGAGAQDLGQVLRETGEPQVLDLMIRPLLEQVAPLYGDDIPDPPAPMGMVAVVRGPTATVTQGPTTRPTVNYFSAAFALGMLQNFDDPRAYQATARIVKNTPALLYVAGIWNPTPLRASDPGVLEALLAHAKDTGPVGMLVARSLASSRDVRAADALLAMLKNDDKELVGEAAMALAITHDFRALAALTALLGEPIEWPDLQAAEMEKMQQGKPGRSVINPRTLVVAALVASRDPATLDALLTLVKDPKADEEYGWLALAAQDAPAAETLIAWVKQANHPNQQMVLLPQGGMGNWMAQMIWQREGIRELPLRVRDDRRWPDLIVARAVDDGVMNYQQDGITPYSNGAVEALKPIVTPDSELALLTLAQAEDKDLAGFATKALKAFHDPGASAPGAAAKP